MTLGRVADCHALHRCSVLGTLNCGKEQGVASTLTKGGMSACGVAAPASAMENSRKLGRLSAIVALASKQAATFSFMLLCPEHRKTSPYTASRITIVLSGGTEPLMKMVRLLSCCRK